jgi:hypothetical protein
MQPETEPLGLGFGLLAPNPLPHFTLSNAPPRHDHHLTCATPLPPTITLHRSFQLRVRNRAPAARFRDFSPSPASQFANPSPHYHHHLIRTTGPCFRAILYPLFRRRARIEPLRLVLGYSGLKPSTVSHLRTHHPTAAVAS